jgi:hypothetical protein
MRYGEQFLAQTARSEDIGCISRSFTCSDSRSLNQCKLHHRMGGEPFGVAREFGRRCRQSAGNSPNCTLNVGGATSGNGNSTNLYGDRIIRGTTKCPSMNGVNMNNAFGRDSWTSIAGRRIKVCDDTKTQSVNICTASNQESEYEQVFYFRDPWRVTVADLNQFSSLDEVTKWLRKRSYDQLQ